MCVCVCVCVCVWVYVCVCVMPLCVFARARACVCVSTCFKVNFNNLLGMARNYLIIYTQRPVEGTLANSMDQDLKLQNAASDSDLHSLH